MHARAEKIREGYSKIVSSLEVFITSKRKDKRAKIIKTQIFK